MKTQNSDEGRIDSAALDELTCPYCERPTTTTIVDDTLTYGSGRAAVDLHVRHPVRHCKACDFDFIDEVGERVRTEAVYRHLGLLTPWEIRAIRERHGLSRASFAEITGLGEATIKRWETGAIAQNRANDRYLRLLNDDSCWSVLQRVAALRNPTTSSLPRGRGEGPSGLEASDGRRPAMDRRRREAQPTEASAISP